MEGNPVVVEAEAFVDASVAAFTAVLSGAAVAGTTGSGTAVSGLGGVEPGADAGGVGDDPLQRVADNALDVLAGVARSEAKLA
ncbi:endonuclease, partial [Pseudarthrobacter oxydans]